MYLWALPIFHVIVWKISVLFINKRIRDSLTPIIRVSESLFFINSYHRKRFFLPGNIGGHCLWSKIPLQSLYASWQKSPNMDLGQRVDTVSLVEMQPCFIKVNTIAQVFLLFYDFMLPVLK